MLHIYRLSIFACLICGCKVWNDNGTNLPRLPAAKMAPESIGVELTFVRLPLDDQPTMESIWAEADEQCVDGQERLHLSKNGIRVGIVNQQLPTTLRKLLDQSTNSPKSHNDSVDFLSRTQRQQWRSAKRAEIVATTTKTEFVFLHAKLDSNELTGETYSNAQGIWGARAFPKADGTVRFELIPEIHHGQIRNQWIATEGSIQYQAGRNRSVISDLAINTTLATGQTLMIGCTTEFRGLGPSLFVDRDHGEPHQKLLLLRLVQTQKDELFDALLEE